MSNVTRQMSWIVPCMIAALIAAGCEHHHMSSGPSDRVVVCDKCQTVWVELPNVPGYKGFRSYHPQPAKVITCPDCESAVANFFKTGKLEHTCKTCGEQLKECVH